MGSVTGYHTRRAHLLPHLQDCVSKGMLFICLGLFICELPVSPHMWVQSGLRNIHSLLEMPLALREVSKYDLSRSLSLVSRALRGWLHLVSPQEYSLRSGYSRSL